MPSLPRSAILQDDSCFHVTWQCHNQSWLLKESWAKQLYYNLLLHYKNRYGVQIYSYCLMDNHPHLSGHLSSLRDFSDFFRVVNARFARLYNKHVKRRGQVVMDRFKSPMIQTDKHLLEVMRYIDLNPKRAGKVNHPNHNEFSSYRYYAFGQHDPLITPAPSYLALASTPEQRQAEYRSLIEDLLQNDWKTKQPFSSSPFIGNPDWVIHKTKILRLFHQQQLADWKQQFRERFGP